MGVGEGLVEGCFSLSMGTSQSTIWEFYEIHNNSDNLYTRTIDSEMHTPFTNMHMRECVCVYVDFRMHVCMSVYFCVYVYEQIW